MTKARTLADMISDGVIGTTELADDVITPVKLDETGSYTIAQLDVNGTLTSDGLTVDGAAIITNTASTNTLTLTGNTGSVAGLRLAAEENHAVILGVNEGNNFGGVKVQTNSNGTLVDRFNVASNGDITMYKDDGTTAGMTFDASAGSMAVGTSNLPSDVSVVAADGIKFDVGTSDTTRIYAKSTGTGSYSLGSSGGSAIAFHRLADNSDEIGFETHHAGNNHTERMRLNYHGQLTLEGTGTPFDTTPSKNGLQLYYESDSGIATIASYSNGGGTQLDFQTNTGAGATDRIMTINTAGVVVNPDAEDKDFRVASDNNSNMLLVDGSTNRVGVGTNSPTHDLTIGMSDLGDASLSFRSSTYSSLGTIKVSHDSGTAESSMRFHTRTGGNEPERMRIDSAGRVTMPYQPMVFVTRSSNQGVVTSSDTGTVVNFDTEIFDVNNNFNISNDRFTAPVTGKYEVSWSYGTNVSSQSVYRTFIWKNGTQLTYTQLRNDSQGTSGYQFAGRTAIIEMSTNDYLELKASTDDGTAFYADSQLRLVMTIRLVG